MIFLNLCEGDIALHHLQKNANVTFETPQKVWHCYIKAFLFKCINFLRTKCNSITNTFYESVLQSQKFIRLSFKHINVTKFKVFVNPTPKSLLYYITKFNSSNYHKTNLNVNINKVHFATGQIYLLHPAILSKQTYMFLFKFDKAIKLNMTFY